MEREPGHILVVEDDPDIREAVAELLRSERFDVQVAENGEEGLRALREMPEPCLVLLDLMMPVVDGWEFCRRKDGDPRLAKIPVVVMSAVPPTDPRNSCVYAVAYLPKPLSLADMFEAVKAHCP